MNTFVWKTQLLSAECKGVLVRLRQRQYPSPQRVGSSIDAEEVAKWDQVLAIRKQ